MVALANTITRKQRDLILPKNVWGVYDTRYADQQGICEAYMAEWGIPLSNLIGVDGKDRTRTAVWSEVGSVVAAAIPSSCQGIFCSPSMNLQAFTFATQQSISYAQFLGYVKVFEKMMTELGHTSFDDLHASKVERYLLRWVKSEFHTDGTASRDIEDSWNKLCAETQGVGSTNAAVGGYSGSKEGNSEETFYTKYYQNYLPNTLEVGGKPLRSFVGTSPGAITPLLFKQLTVEAHVADFQLGRTLKERNKWDAIPSWRLGWADSRGDPKMTGIPAFTAEDATALARRSKATRTSIKDRKKLSSVVGINTVGSSATHWLGVGYWCMFDRLLLDLGFEEDKIKMGYYTTYTDLNGDTVGGIPDATGYTRYDFDNMHYKYDVGEANRVLPVNGETLPFDVDNFFYDGINRNTGYSTSVPSPTYFEEGHADQVYSIKDGAVGFSTPSYSNGQGSWFIKAGGVAYRGSYLEPFADESSNSANSFFFNLLRGHQAATASMMSNSEILSEEELIGDGLAQPFAEQATAPPRGGSFYHAEVNTEKVDMRKKKYNWLKS